MAQPTAPAPSHLPLVAAILLIWHALLVADYAIDRFALGQEDWPALMPLMPLDATWLLVVWAMGVVLGLLASLFLAMKDDASVLLFFAAAVSMAALAVGAFLNAPPVLLLPVPLWLILGLLVLLPLGGWLYARALNRGGVLH